MLSWVPALQAGEQNQSPGTKPISETSLFSPIRFLTCWRSRFLKPRQINQLLRTSPGNQSILLRAEPPTIYPLWLLPSTLLQPQPLSISHVETHTPPLSPCSPKPSFLEPPSHTQQTYYVCMETSPHSHCTGSPPPSILTQAHAHPGEAVTHPACQKGTEAHILRRSPGSQRQGATLDWNADGDKYKRPSESACEFKDSC